MKWLLWQLLVTCWACSVQGALPKHLAKQLERIWDDDKDLNATDVEHLRRQAWDMFDEGFNNYMKLAFPMDNLMPISCKGADWQGGMAMTLLDSLDALLMFGRLGDMRTALPLIRQHVHFKARDIKVHVFEVVIRVVGGLLSAHSLLERIPDAFPGYDGSLLELATQLADRLSPAFDSPTGLPFQFTNLAKGPITDVRTTCTACAGTLLLEYGTLSALTGDPKWRQAAEHAASLLYNRRSSLGLVGSSLDVLSSTWVSREATIGPGTDSFYEYMIKSYLMFGNRTHLEMFSELYMSAMRHLQLPGTVRGYAFLADVHMDSGRMSRPFVSSLGAFWPAMQALVGQVQDAIELHSNFTAAWQTWGWLPELFGLDLSRVHPEDPGYNLRPEHIESTYVLHALTGKPIYRKTAARMQHTLQAANRVKCGYASVSNVETGDHVDLQESFFLSETVKYLYLTFSPGSQHLLDYYILSTEGHLLPTFPPDDPDQEAVEIVEYEQGVAAGPPPNCAALCKPLDGKQQAVIEQQLRRSFPLMVFDRHDAVTIKRRRCIACIHVQRHMETSTKAHDNLRQKIQQLSTQLQAAAAAPGGQHRPLSQAVCVLSVSRSGKVSCATLRPLTAHDLQHGLPHNAVMLQLAVVQSMEHRGLLLVTPVSPDDKASLLLPAATATFGSSLLEITPSCMRQLLNTTQPWLDYAAQARGRDICVEPERADGQQAKTSWGEVMSTYEATCRPWGLQDASMPVSSLLLRLLVAQRAVSHAPHSTTLASSPAKRQQQRQQREAHKAACNASGSQQAAGGQQADDNISAAAAAAAHKGMRNQADQGKQRPGVHWLQHDDQGVAITDADVVDPTGAWPDTDEIDAAPDRLCQDNNERAGVSALNTEREGVVADAEYQHERQGSADLDVAGQSAASSSFQPRQHFGSDIDRELDWELAQVCCDGLSAICVDTAACVAVWARSGVPHGRGMQQDCSRWCGPGLPSEQRLRQLQHLEQGMLEEQEASDSTTGRGMQEQEDGGSRQRECRQCKGGVTEGDPADNGHAVAQGLSTDQAAVSRWKQKRPPAGDAPHALEEEAIAADGAPAQQQVQQEECVADVVDLPWVKQDPHQQGACKHVPVTYGELVLAEPIFSCSVNFTNADQLAGSVAVVVRGQCGFQTKALAAQSAGAVGVIVLNLHGEEELVTMAGDVGVAAHSVRIPSLMLGPTHGKMLLQAMLNAAEQRLPRPVATMALDHVKLHSGLDGMWQTLSPSQGPLEGLKGGAGRTTRVELLIPTSSHAFIQAHVLSRGHDLQASMDQLLADDRVLLLLVQLAKEDEAAQRQQEL